MEAYEALKDVRCSRVGSKEEPTWHRPTLDTYKDMCTYIYTCIHACVNICMYVCTYVRVCMFVGVCVYIYIYVHLIHTHTHLVSEFLNLTNRSKLKGSDTRNS